MGEGAAFFQENLLLTPLPLLPREARGSRCWEQGEQGLWVPAAGSKRRMLRKVARASQSCGVQAPAPGVCQHALAACPCPVPPLPGHLSPQQGCYPARLLCACSQVHASPLPLLPSSWQQQKVPGDSSCFAAVHAGDPSSPGAGPDPPGCSTLGTWLPACGEPQPSGRTVQQPPLRLPREVPQISAQVQRGRERTHVRLAHLSPCLLLCRQYSPVDRAGGWGHGRAAGLGRDPGLQ